MNFGNLQHATQLFAAYLKKHGPSCYHGRSDARIIEEVKQRITAYGFNSDPEYSLGFIGVCYRNGALVEWNPKGGFYRTVSN